MPVLVKSCREGDVNSQYGNGLMRRRGSDEYEAQVDKCDSLSDLRKAAVKYPNFLDSISPVKILLSDLFQRLKLKEKSFSIGSSATPMDIEAIYEFISRIDPSLDCTGSLRKSILTTHPDLKRFFDHCCRHRHYFFEIRKCNESACDICLPRRLQSAQAIPRPYTQWNRWSLSLF